MPTFRKLEDSDNKPRNASNNANLISTLILLKNIFIQFATGTIYIYRN